MGQWHARTGEAGLFSLQLGHTETFLVKYPTFIVRKFGFLTSEYIAAFKINKLDLLYSRQLWNYFKTVDF